MSKAIVYRCTRCGFKFKDYEAGKTSYQEYAGGSPQTEDTCPACGAMSHLWEDLGESK